MTLRTIVSRTEAWPIAVSTILGTAHSSEALDAALTEWIAYMERGPHALIVDLTRGNAGSTAKQRAQIARRVNPWIKEPQARSKMRNQLAIVLVLDSELVRGIVTAVHWLLPGANPYFVAATLDQAVDIAVGELAKAGIPVTAALAARARGLAQDT